MTKTIVRYSFENIKEEARQLVQQGRLGRQQKIYTLCEFLPSGEWQCIEYELEKNDFLPRDSLIDLLADEDWSED
jgi:hypothetical protein